MGLKRPREVSSIRHPLDGKSEEESKIEKMGAFQIAFVWCTFGIIIGQLAAHYLSDQKWPLLVLLVAVLFSFQFVFIRFVLEKGKSEEGQWRRAFDE